jgi:hypothetical protein
MSSVNGYVDDEMTYRARGGLPAVIGWALALALIIGITATVVGAILHSEERRTCNEGSNGCVDYQEHGWPWAWRSGAPDWVIERQIQNTDSRFFSFNDSGLAPGMFLFILTCWFFVIVIGEVILALITWGLWRVLGRIKHASSV